MSTDHASRDPEILALTKQIDVVSEQVYLLVDGIDKVVVMLKEYTEKEAQGE